MKEPKPEPSVVWLPLTTGLLDVLQQTPRAVTAEPPALVTLPPQVALVLERLLTAVVVTVGRLEGGAVVVNDTTFPYDVPSEVSA